MSNSPFTHGIFLHGLWRSGSTYIWSRFRAAENTYCFYEPLHQGLGRLTHERIARDTPSVVAANAHPSLSQPYFEEFRPLIKSRGVQGFQQRFAYKDFALDTQNEDAQLQNYITKLCHYAAEQNLQPVLGFNRTIFRLPWLQKHFDAYHIYINRNPREIWNSYMRHVKEGNYTYFTTWLMIIEQNATHPLFAPLAERLNLRSGIEKLLSKPKPYYRNLVDNLPEVETYFLVYYLWQAAQAQAGQTCHQIIDLSRADENNYAQDCSNQIKQTCGLDVTFTELQSRSESQEPYTLNFDEVESEVKKLAS